MRWHSREMVFRFDDKTQWQMFLLLFFCILILYLIFFFIFFWFFYFLQYILLLRTHIQTYRKLVTPPFFLFQNSYVSTSIYFPHFFRWMGHVSATQRPPCWCPSEGHQHGISIQSSRNLGGTFFSEKRANE